MWAMHIGSIDRFIETGSHYLIAVAANLVLSETEYGI